MSALVARWGLSLACIVALTGCESCESCDRSTRPGSRESPYVYSPLPNGAILVEARPVIPRDLRANCHVCPDLCPIVDLRPLPAGMVVQMYRQGATAYASRERRYEGYQKLEQMACIVAGGGSALQERFLQLLGDDDPAVRFPAAIHVLQYRLDVAAGVASLKSMIGGETEQGLYDGPFGSRYATYAHTALVDVEMGGAPSLL